MRVIRGKPLMEEGILYKNLSYKIVGLAMQVHRELGFGFLEKVYENALMVILEEMALKPFNKFRFSFLFTEGS